MIIRAVIIPSPKPMMKCVVTMANKTVPTGIDIVPPIAYWIVKAIDENTTKVSFYGLFIILILLLSLVTPFASSSPDGLESVAEEFGFTQTDGIVLLLDDYGISAVNNDFISTVLSALLGVTVLAIMFNLIISRRKSGKNS